MDQLARAVRWKRWFVATSHCALLAELIHESTTGDTYGMHGDKPRDALHEPLLLLRNACFHPAMARTEDQNGAPIEKLQRYLDKDVQEQPLAGALRKDPAVLLDAPFTAWAIFHLHKAGEWETNPRHGVDRY
ncbi:MAG: hypothetical protein HY904_09340 [Deltaproteobacteria bacterium]|nr:hypothetical protein [Deltaproteobacteria bacterium]